ncbi:MAG: NADH-quinone oxidoreductase subunit NuoE, partial [Alphaproteobacteria bacterium]
MTVRRLAESQPDNFEFNAESQVKAEREIAKYPEGRQYSAIIALLWLAQLQHDNWLPEPAIRHVADILEMPYIRALEVATFYTMFNLAPVGRKAHIQVCGTTPCMLRGAEELKQICRDRIHHNQQELSDDGDFSWIEVECAGTCVNAPMVQIDSDTYEDLTPVSFNRLIDDIAAGHPLRPGPQVDRQFSEPAGGATSLLDEIAGAPTAPSLSSIVEPSNGQDRETAHEKSAADD